MCDRRGERWPLESEEGPRIPLINSGQLPKMKLACIVFQKLPSFLFFKLNIEIIVYSQAHVRNTTEGHPVSVVTLCITVVCYYSQESDMDTVHQQTPVD